MNHHFPHTSLFSTVVLSVVAALGIGCGGGGGGGSSNPNAAAIQAFQAVLGNSANNSTSPGLGLSNAAELTDALYDLSTLPTVDLSIDGQQDTWWVCVWEVDDQVNNETYTVGALIDTDLQPLRYVAWRTNQIGVQTIELDTPTNNNTETGVMVLQGVQSFVGITPDTTGDIYEVISATLTGQIVHNEPCTTNQNPNYKIEVEKVNLDFTLEGDFVDALNQTTTHVLAVPPAAPMQSTGPVPSLRFRYLPCP